MGNMAKTLKTPRKPLGRPPGTGMNGHDGTRVVSVRLHPSDYQKVVEYGQSHGLVPSQSVRRIINEHLA